MSAKKNLFIFILAFCSLSACKKNESDDISFHEFSPNVEVNNIDSFAVAFPAPDCLPGIPCPGDSIATYDLDINSDGSPDFQIKVKHIPNPNGYSTQYPCANLISEMDISATNDDSQISSFQSLNTSIDENNQGWDDQLSLVGYSTSNFTGVGYIGLRIKSGQHYNYGWLKLMRIPENTNKHGIALLSYGYNNTPDKKILAGQEN